LDVLPVAIELRARHGLDTVFALADEALAAPIARAGFRALPLDHFVGPDLLAVHRQARAAAERVAALTADVEQRAFAGLDAVESAALARSTRRVFGECVLDLVSVTHALARLLDELRPLAVIAGNPYTLEGRVAALLAKARAVPTAALEHGSIFPDDPIWQECRVDRVCAWGEASRRALLTCGVAEESIAVTGSPRIDQVRQAARPADADAITL